MVVVTKMGHMGNVKKLREELQKQGRKYTLEREELLQVIFSEEDVYSLDELYQRAHRQNAIHAKSTIYRNLDFYLKAGFIMEAGKPSARKRYKTNYAAFN
jgi:Fe2+ or Zn2+ uptake regulation protein